MAINVENINTGGAIVKIGATTALNTVDADGFVIGLATGVDVGATTGGVKIAYSYETQDIYCDQHLAAVETAIISETATVEFEMLESDSDNLRYAIGLYESSDDASDKKTSVGGKTIPQYYALELTIPDNDAPSARNVVWTFFKTRSQGFESNFERENPTTIKVTFTAYANTSFASGHQLFSINEDI